MDPIKTDAATSQQRFESALGQPPFAGLKAILDRLCPDPARRCAAALAASTYVELLAGLGYRLTVTRQIHVQDCYSRLGPEGGIKAVLPCYDIPTQSSVPTLVNFDGTVTATPKSAAFFEALFQDLKRQITAQPSHKT